MEADENTEVKRGSSKKTIIKSTTVVAVLICIAVSSVYFMHGRHVQYHGHVALKQFNPQPQQPPNVQRPNYPPGGYGRMQTARRPYRPVVPNRMNRPLFDRVLNRNAFNNGYRRQGGFDYYNDYNKPQRRPNLDYYYDYNIPSDYQVPPPYGGYRRTGGQIGPGSRQRVREPEEPTQSEGEYGIHKEVVPPPLKSQFDYDDRSVEEELDNKADNNLISDTEDVVSKANSDESMRQNIEPIEAIAKAPVPAIVKSPGTNDVNSDEAEDNMLTLSEDVKESETQNHRSESKTDIRNLTKATRSPNTSTEKPEIIGNTRSNISDEVQRAGEGNTIPNITDQIREPEGNHVIEPEVNMTKITRQTQSPTSAAFKPPKESPVIIGKAQPNIPAQVKQSEKEEETENGRDPVRGDVSKSSHESENLAADNIMNPANNDKEFNPDKNDRSSGGDKQNIEKYNAGVNSKDNINDKVANNMRVFDKDSDASVPAVDKQYGNHNRQEHYGFANPYYWDVTSEEPTDIKCIRAQTMFSKFSVCVCDEVNDPDDKVVLSNMGRSKSRVVEDIQLLVLENRDAALIDVGAGIGILSLAVASLRREVIAVEPHLVCITTMQQAVKMNAFTSLVKMFQNVVSNDASNMLISHQNGKVEYKPAPQFGHFDPNDMVTSITLNDLARAITLKKAVLRVDIPGFVGEAFEQADELFSKVDIVAVAVRWDKNEANLCKFLVDFFQHKGYRPYSSFISTPLDSKAALELSQKYILWKKIKPKTYKH